MTIIIDDKKLEEIIIQGIIALNLIDIAAYGKINTEVKCYRKGKKICAKIILR